MGEIVSITGFLAITLGSALGGALRYLVFSFLPLPLSLVNILGSFFIGFSLHKLGQSQSSLFFNAGVLGGFTTFSAFSLALFQLLNSGEWIKAILYIAVSISLALLACYAGFKLSYNFQ